MVQPGPVLQYNIILLKKLSGRSLTRIKLHVVVTSDQQLSLKSSLTMKLQSDKRCDPRLSVRSCRLGRKLYVSSCRRSGNSSLQVGWEQTSLVPCSLKSSDTLRSRRVVLPKASTRVNEAHNTKAATYFLPGWSRKLSWPEPIVS